MKKFNEAGIPLPLIHRLEQLGFTTPTPIQEKSIPVALEGSDILGSAQTGTGKTLAFGVPLIANLMTNDRGTALVLLPTRELASQVLKSLAQFSSAKSKISTALLIGGEDMRRQITQLKSNPRLIVGTPGRINDHLTRGTLKLHNTNFLVLDEVDRMLDLGFGIQLDAIAKFLTSPKRQTLMFSATMPKNIQALSAKYLKNPVRITVGAEHKPTENLTQENVKLSESEKYPRLLEELDSREGSIIVFIKTKYAADSMAQKLRKLGHKANALHGDLRQNKRSQVIEGFRKQSYRILIATDVAARGLDIPHIQHVINHDLPQCPEDYIHRIGRTARAGATGNALNFLSSSDGSKWRAIQRLLDPNAKPDDLGERRGGRKRSGPRGGSNGKNRGRSDSRPARTDSKKRTGKPSNGNFTKRKTAGSWPKKKSTAA
ncbi:MAG: DEAD/DEAH box helicase [Rickettsiaceae bacterium]|nr:DEAD/DEAH box helicase [Rickettsiaceae bacterium]